MSNARPIRQVSREELAQIEHLVEYCCSGMGITRDSFFEMQRLQLSVCSAARKLIVLLAQDRYAMPLSTLSAYFGRGKTAMAHDRKQACQMLERSSKFSQTLQNLFARLYSEYKAPSQHELNAFLYSIGGRDPRSIRWGNPAKHA